MRFNVTCLGTCIHDGIGVSRPTFFCLACLTIITVPHATLSLVSLSPQSRLPALLPRFFDFVGAKVDKTACVSVFAVDDFYSRHSVY
jgi:hypothetical protein